MLDALINSAARIALRRFFENSSTTITQSWWDGPPNELTPLFNFLPPLPAGKVWMIGWGFLAFIALSFTSHFMVGVLGILFVSGLYSLLYGGAILQMPSWFTVPRIYHFLGWKARTVGCVQMAIVLILLLRG
jgi:hypothetical protein